VAKGILCLTTVMQYLHNIYTYYNIHNNIYLQHNIAYAESEYDNFTYLIDRYSLESKTVS